MSHINLVIAQLTVESLWPNSLKYLFGLAVKRWSAESEGLKLDSSWRPKSFILTQARERWKHIFLHLNKLTYKIYCLPDVVWLALDITDRRGAVHCVPEPALGNLSQANFSGQGIPNSSSMGRQPFLTLMQRSLHGLNGALQEGAYKEHRKKERSGEQPNWTRGENCWTSKAASPRVSWLRKLGNSVILNCCRPLQIGMVVVSHFPARKLL